MKILVTGGAGFIGSHVVDSFIAAGHDVAVVDDLSTGRRANLDPRAAFYEIDLRTPDLRRVFERERPEVVSHHAAQVDVRRSMADPTFDASVNVLGALNLLECAHQFGTRKMVYISSGGAVYGEPEALPCTEEHPIRPLSPYGASKYIVEKYLSIYRENYHLDYTILRYANVYGPRQDPHGEAGVVALFVGAMLSGTQPVIFGDGEQTRDFVYVGDCARANLLALGRGSGRAYNIGTGAEASINHLAALLKEITGYDGRVAYDLPKAGDVYRTYLDVNRAREELGWTPTVSLEDGLRRTVAHFRET
ncbi:MAG: NAD-dependent epimerase/dehydratase family protein [Anaerolineae bacterium]|nr:NAD-dependent epimerase/dehydratase family protein [Anaerolineae bacterium]